MLIRWTLTGSTTCSGNPNRKTATFSPELRKVCCKYFNSLCEIIQLWQAIFYLSINHWWIANVQCFAVVTLQLHWNFLRTGTFSCCLVRKRTMHALLKTVFRLQSWLGGCTVLTGAKLLRVCETCFYFYSIFCICLESLQTEKALFQQLWTFFLWFWGEHSGTSMRTWNPLVLLWWVFLRLFPQECAGGRK